MDQIVNVIMIIVGIYLIYVSRQLVTKHNLKAFYSEKNLESIPLRNRYAYAENVGKWLGFIGRALILSAALFFLDDYVHNHFIFIAGEVVLLGGLVFGFGKIYFVVKEAQKNPKKKK